ncbi:MAG: DUF1461 domain-containing protein, partial [Moraxellaceae bacterium]
QGHTGFEKTTKAERERVFAEIAKSIRSSGEGLAQIHYKVEGEADKILLTEDEVLHLQDVSKLIDLAPFAVIPAWLILIGLIIRSIKTNKPLPSVMQQLIGFTSVSVLIGIVLAVVGPKAVFTQLHIWVFPANHKWFFYYQDSLMSTMMHAPVLFAGIAAEWALLATVFFVVLQLIVKQSVDRKIARSSRLS